METTGTNLNGNGKSFIDSIKENMADGSVAPSPSSFWPLSWTTWIILILVLAFLGFNIFVYLAVGTQGIADYLGPIIKNVTSYFGSLALETTKQTANVAATGTSVAASSTANAVTYTANTIENVSGATPAVLSTVGQEITQNASQDTTLANALSSASTFPEQQKGGDNYEADDSASSIQMSKSTNKAGWCFIGEDRGFRSCIEVGENDTCMSGDIFPSSEICVNPSLRQ